MPLAEPVARVIVFARSPRPGHTKTRLIPALGPEGAARLYGGFLEDTLAKVRSLADVAVEVWVAADADRAFFDDARLQVEGDLGQRMSHALADALQRGERALVIGTDAPTVPVAYLRAAIDTLARSEVVLGPSADGGYYLIGARAKAPELRGVRWSSRHTLSDTLGAIGDAVEVALLQPWYDIDTPGDLRILRSHLFLRPEAAPATAAILADFDPLLGA